MTLFDKDIYNTDIPVCKKHNFRGIYCVQCMQETHVNKDDILKLLKLLQKWEQIATNNAEADFAKNWRDNKQGRNFYIFLGQRKMAIQVQKYINKILKKYVHL